MTPSPSVLIGLRASPARDRLERCVRHLGFRPAVTGDGAETLSWVRERRFEASLLDSALAGESGQPVWRTVRQIVGRRLVLLAESPRRDLFFEALGAGVGTVLPLPPVEAMVRAALAALTDAGSSRTRWFHSRRGTPHVEDQAAE